MSSLERPNVPSSNLALLAATFGTIFLGMGANALLNPRTALGTMFAFSPPSDASDALMVDSLLMLFGIKDIFMGAVIYAAAFLGNRRTLGAILMAAGLAAGADGLIVKDFSGTGEFNHWGYGGVVFGLGAYTLFA